VLEVSCGLQEGGCWAYAVLVLSLHCAYTHGMLQHWLVMKARELSLLVAKHPRCTVCWQHASGCL
jgi:hypothetical protein